MNIISLPKGKGKTTELIKLCAEQEKAGITTYIVVPTHRRALDIVTAAQMLGIEIPFPMVFGAELTQLRSRLSPFIKSLLIDDLDECLRQLGPVTTATVTSDS